MSDEKRAQVKRAILAELNKELSKTTRTLTKSSSKRKHYAPKAKQTELDLVPRGTSAKLHKPIPVKPKFDAQKFADNVSSKSNLASADDGFIQSSSTAIKKNVYIPQPTPRIEHEPPRTPPYASVRKYANLWLNNTFGKDRSTFSKATSLYKSKLTKKVLSSWRKETYSKQTEWKLVVRADCHYRFYLKEKSWETWRKFLVENKEMCQKKELADQKCSDILQKRYFNLLRVAVRVRKEVNANKTVAQSIYERNLTSKMLNQWHYAMAERCIAHQQENIALHFWSLSLQRQCLEQWISYKNEQILKRKMNTVVSNFYAGKLIRQSFKAWILYRQQRKCKEIQRRKAEKLLKTKLQHKFFYQWADQFAISIKTKQLENEIHMIWYKARCRRAFVHWREFCKIQDQNRLSIQIADEHAKKKIAQRTMDRFRSYTKHQQQTVANKETAAAFNKKTILSSCFSKWVEELDKIEEDKLKYRTLMARKHHQLKLLSVALQRWAAYKEYKADLRECYSIADCHYQTAVTQRMFTNWHLYLCYRKALQVKKDTAEMHRNELLNHKYFYTWLKMYHVSQNQRQDERIAVLHNNSVLLSKHFKMWRYRSEERAMSKSNELTAQDHYQTKLTKKVFSALVSYKQATVDKVVLNQQAYTHFNSKQLKQVFASWKDYNSYKIEKKRKEKIADEHYCKHLISAGLKNWNHYHKILNKGKVTVRDIQTQHNKQLLSKLLARWLSQVKIQKLATDLNLRAELHFRETFTRKVLLGWLSHTEQQARDHVVKQELLADGRHVLQRLRVRQVFDRWKERTAAERRDRELCEVADQHRYRTVMAKVLDAFNQNVKLQFKKMILRRKHDNFVSDHVVEKMFLKWKSAFNERMIEKKQTEQALWFWLV